MRVGWSDEDTLAHSERIESDLGVSVELYSKIRRSRLRFCAYSLS